MSKVFNSRKTCRFRKLAFPNFPKCVSESACALHSALRSVLSPLGLAAGLLYRMSGLENDNEREISRTGHICRQRNGNGEKHGHSGKNEDETSLPSVSISNNRAEQSSSRQSEEGCVVRLH